MSRRQSISSSSYYQPSSRPESPAVFTSSSSSSANNNNNTSSSKQYSHQNLAPPQQQYQQQQQQQQPPPPPRNQKADQILQNFYVKVIQIVVLARVTHPDVHAGITPKKGSLRGVPLVKKTSKWFNLELEDLDIYKEDAKFWRAMAITESPPTMLVELFLDTSELSSNQVLVLLDETNRKNRVDLSGTGLHSVASTPLGQSRIRRNIILESWSLNLSNTPPDPVPEAPVVYKKSIIFFRSLFAYMRLLPAYQLYRQLKKQNHPLRIGFRVSRGQSPEESMFRESEIGIEVPLIEGETRPMLSEYRFGQVETPLGAFSLKVTYRSNCEFQVDESEAMLSSRFIDMDENYFTPTIVAHSQEPSAPTRRPPSSTPLVQRPNSEMYNSGALQENPVPTLRPRRNSAQSLQQRSGEYSSSQSSVSSLGTRMSRRGSNGGPGGLFMPIENQNVAGTPPFSVAHGGHAAVAKHYVDPIMESPPFKLSTSQTDNRRQPSSSFSPFKSPSLSSSPSPSFLEAQPPSLSSRPSSVHLNRSPSSSSMSRVQSSQMQNSGLLGSVPKTGGTLSSLPSGGGNMLSTSVKSNASSSTSAPRVTSSFGHRHDSSGRRASSESLPPGRNRNSIVGNSSLFQLTSDDDDVNEFMKMLDTPEPLKMFGKAGGSGIGPSFASDDSTLTASGMKTKSTLDRFQQLKQINSNLSESMSNSQILAKEQQNQQNQPPLTVTTNLNRRSTLGDMEPSSPTGLPFATTVGRHSQSFSSHQPGTPSPLHSEAPVYPSRSSGRVENQSGLSHSSSREPTTGSTPIKRQSWLLNHESPSGGSGIHRDLVRRSANIGNIAFRHGSLDQGKDILGMEEAMGRMKVEGAGDDIAFGSYPEDVHHQHSLYSAPLNTGREGSSSSSSNAAPFSTFGADPRPIPSLASGGTSTGRPGRLLRLGSGSSGASFTLPRLRPRAAEDNESLNELNSADSAERRNRRRQSRHGRDEDEEDEMDDDGDDEDADLRGRRDVQGSDKDDKLGHNTSLNDDDDMLFIMSELSPGSNSCQDMGHISTGLGASPSGGMMAGGGPGLNERGAGGMLPLTGAMLNLRSQSQSPALGSGSGAASSSSSPHLRLFGRSNNNNNGGNGNNGTTGHPLGHNNGNGSGGNSHHSSNNNSRSNSVSHSRVGSGSNTNNHNSIEHLGLLRRSGSGSGAGFVDELLLMNAAGNLIGGSNSTNHAGDYLPATPMTPPPLLSSAQQSQQSGLPPVGYTSGTNPTATGGAYDTLMGGRRMSRGGSDRGAGSGASSAYNSFHSDSRGW